jgi:hypothetical protein
MVLLPNRSFSLIGLASSLKKVDANIRSSLSLRFYYGEAKMNMKLLSLELEVEHVIF